MSVPFKIDLTGKVAVVTGGVTVVAATGADAADGTAPGRAAGAEPFGTSGITPADPVGSWARA